MLVSLDQTREGHVEDLREATLYALGPHLSGKPDPGREKRFHERIASLDEQQRQAIRAWVKLVRAQSPHPKDFTALDPKGVWA